MTETSITMALINYYAREGLYHQMQVTCSGILKKRGEDPVFRLWKGFSLFKQGAPTDALREYEQAKGKREVELALVHAMLFAHRKCKLVDQEAVDELEARARDEDRATEQATMLAACFFWHVDDHSKARELISKIRDYSDEYMSASTLHGWIDLTCSRTTLQDKSVHFFDAVLNSDTPRAEIEALMGKAAYLEHKRQYVPALEIINRIVAQTRDFTPALVQKAKVLIKSQDWDQAVEICQRILGSSSYNIEALMLYTLFTLVRESGTAAAISNLQTLCEAIESLEPNNPQLHYRVCCTISRLAAGNTTILHCVRKLIERAIQALPEGENKSDYLTERGHTFMLTGDHMNALACYKEASQADEGNISALAGVIKCKLLMGKLSDVEQQLTFLDEIQSTMGRSAELIFLSALLRGRKGELNQSIAKLDEAVQLMEESIKGMEPCFDFYGKFNPQLLLEIIKEYLQHCPTEPIGPTDPPSPITKKALVPLQLFVNHIPGSMDGQLLFARTRFISGDIKAAKHAIAQCLRLDFTSPDAHILSAHIALHDEDYLTAQQELEQALSLEFEVRDSVHFNLLKARVTMALNDLEEACNVLNHAMDLVKAQPHGTATGKRRITPHERVSVYLELSQCYLKMKKMTEAQNMIAEAMKQFKGTKEEGRVTIANAMVMAKSDVDKALAILRTVPSASQYFLKAKAQMANIYLNQRNNKRAFAQCYEELVNAYPSSSSYMFLGEAYMNIQEPEKAIKAFEQAVQLDPQDTEIAAKIGKALIQTHEYSKAIEYYTNAVEREPTKTFLRHDLATLFWRMGMYEQAETTLRAAKDMSEERKDVSSATDVVKTQQLLSKVHQSANRLPNAIDSLVQAQAHQSTVLKRLRSEQPDVVYQQHIIAADIDYRLGELYNESGNESKATNHYNNALKHDQTHEKSMLALAHLYLQRGEFEACEHHCNALLRVDSGHEEASMMMADLMSRKKKYEDAMFHFQQLLDKRPTNYEVLVQYVQLLRRAGRLYEAPKFFKLAEKANTRKRLDPGLHYAKGLYARYTNDPKEALTELNSGRSQKDSVWSEKCVIAMIEVYLNPDNDNIWEESNEKTDISTHMTTIELLLKEVTDKNKKALLEAYSLIATKKKDNMEKALAKLYEITVEKGGGQPTNTVEKVNIPCMVGMATALQMMKQTPKARCHLKRVARAPYNQEEADDFERGWLLLADIYIGTGKFDMAQELLKKAITANKSCGRAWEFMGLIYEKEQSYSNAADCYENAWRLVNETDPSIGYKLAFNYLKAKRYVNAIDVCQKVLQARPQYPKIKKDILDKARASLRP
eukprot:TRINITY_DN68132_c2_g2_i2.p1 TRINITY_DN68132_c2_g2~~TRINITY_DN68132_c2_g2_i2.p1  ORF type:complete len:1314 (+),score=179.62 TRINITY_DN68132_c2_g2_i2:92-4033(+)